MDREDRGDELHRHYLTTKDIIIDQNEPQTLLFKCKLLIKSGEQNFVGFLEKMQFYHPLSLNWVV